MLDPIVNFFTRIFQSIGRGIGDNLLQFIDRIANDIGGTSAILRDRSEKYNSGWFDTRADDRFWFAYGQLYGYYGILTAARTDFKDVIAQRGLTQLWSEFGGPVARVAQYSAHDHLERSRIRLADAFAFGDDGLLRLAGALQPRRDKAGSGSVRTGDRDLRRRPASGTSALGQGRK